MSYRQWVANLNRFHQRPPVSPHSTRGCPVLPQVDALIEKPLCTNGGGIDSHMVQFKANTFAALNTSMELRSGPQSPPGLHIFHVKTAQWLATRRQSEASNWALKWDFQPGNPIGTPSLGWRPGAANHRVGETGGPWHIYLQTNK